MGVGVTYPMPSTARSSGRLRLSWLKTRGPLPEARTRRSSPTSSKKSLARGSLSVSCGACPEKNRQGGEREGGVSERGRWDGGMSFCIIVSVRGSHGSSVGRVRVGKNQGVFRNFSGRDNMCMWQCVCKGSEV
jgi:hypothetical protein